MLLYFIPFNNKKIYYILLGVSLVLGTFINLSDFFLNFISFFSIIDGAMRSVNHVLNSDHYSLGIWSFLPLTILGFSFEMCIRDRLFGHRYIGPDLSAFFS